MRSQREIAAWVAALAVLLNGANARAGEDSDPSATFFASPPESPPPPRPQAATGSAAPWPILGGRGQLVVGGGSVLGGSSTTASNSAASSVTFSLSPQVDYFVFRNVSVGLVLDATHASVSGYGAGGLVDTDETSVSGGARVGYNLSFGHVLSFWPRVAVSIAWLDAGQHVAPLPAQTRVDARQQTTTSLGPAIDAFLPLDVQVAPHLLLGIGPSLHHEFGGVQGGPDFAAQRTFVGAAVEVAGYLGGKDAAVGRQGRASAPARFGRSRELVLSNEETLGGGYSYYANTHGWADSVQASLGVDYFLFDYVSIGALATAAYSEEVGPDLLGTRVTTQSEALAAGPRLGCNVPLGRALSIYPRVGVTIGPGAIDQTVRTSSTATFTDVALSASVPLLAHPANHFFVGFGPTVDHDLSRVFHLANGTSVDLSATTWGASLIVGGWIGV